MGTQDLPVLFQFSHPTHDVAVYRGAELKAAIAAGLVGGLGGDPHPKNPVPPPPPAPVVVKSYVPPPSPPAPARNLPLEQCIQKWYKVRNGHFTTFKSETMDISPLCKSMQWK